MKDFVEFKAHLIPELKDLEAFRLEKLKEANHAQAAYFIPAFMVLIAIAIIVMGHLYFGLGIIFIALLVVSVINSEVVGQHEKKYLTLFKKDLLKSFVQAINSKANYHAFRKVPRALFDDSNLYKGSDFGYSGEDYFWGETENGYKFQFSEIKSVEQSGKNSHLAFKGLFFVIETPHQNYPNITVRSNKSNSSSLIPSFFDSAIPVDLFKHNMQLQKAVDVFCYKSKKQCLKILSPEMADAILELKKNWPYGFQISYKKRKIFIAINYQKDLFEARINESIMRDFFIKRLYGQLERCFSVVEDFAEAVDSIAGHKVILPEEKPLDNNDDLPYDHLIDY